MALWIWWESIWHNLQMDWLLHMGHNNCEDQHVDDFVIYRWEIWLLLQILICSTILIETFIWIFETLKIKDYLLLYALNCLYVAHILMQYYTITLLFIINMPINVLQCVLLNNQIWFLLFIKIIMKVASMILWKWLRWYYGIGTSQKSNQQPPQEGT